MFTLGPRELIVGLGSNSTNALEMLRNARSRLRSHPLFRLRSCAPIYESDALLPENAPPAWDLPYLNSACLLEVSDDLGESDAPTVLHALKEIELAVGRKPAPRWAPRLIDLDVLIWGGPRIQCATLQIPHAGLRERPFALLPAMDCLTTTATSTMNSATGSTVHDPSIEQLARLWRYSQPEAVPQKTRLSQKVWPEIVGVLNLTPDSFSDGHANSDNSEIEAFCRQLISDGATVIDVGAESTRPGASSVSSRVECERLEKGLGILSRLKKQHSFKISLDSRNPETVSWCLERFAIDWLNDVEGFTDPRMMEVGARAKSDLVFMHSLGVPPRQDRVIPPIEDPLHAVLDWGKSKIAQLRSAGVDPARLIFDPGIGFGKTAQQNITLLLRAKELSALKCRLLIGHSRKRFLDPTSEIPAADRDLETSILTAGLVNSGADFLRVHSSRTQARAMRLGARLV